MLAELLTQRDPDGYRAVCERVGIDVDGEVDALSAWLAARLLRGRPADCDLLDVLLEETGSSRPAPPDLRVAGRWVDAWSRALVRFDPWALVRFDPWAESQLEDLASRPGGPAIILCALQSAIVRVGP
ncbi:hypothetical protein GCM10028801_44480 [Nocardioides maradonensis]